MVSAIVLTIQPAARAVRRRIKSSRRPASLPKRSENRLWISRLKRQVNRARVFVMEQHFLPVGSSVFRTKDTALLVRSVGVTQGSHEHAVCVVWIHQDSSNLP